MKKFSLAAAAAIVAGALFVPAASATMSDEAFEADMKEFKAQTCEKLQSAKVYLEADGVKTRNDAYDMIIKENNERPDESRDKMSKEQAQKAAAIFADRLAECKVVSFPVTERVTTFFGSKGQNSSTSSIGGFSS